MIDYGLKNKTVLITGANNPRGIGAATALAFAREGAKVVLVYKKIARPFDESKIDRNGADRYFCANAGNADRVAEKLKELNADFLVIEEDISDEILAQHYNDTMRNAYLGNKLAGIIPCMSIYDFLNKMKEV